MSENTSNGEQKVTQERNEAGFIKQEMEISKRVAKPGEKGQNEKVGDITYWVPDLEAFKLGSIELDKLDDDGLPIYKQDVHNWVYGAILAATKANVRNKLVSGTASFKEGSAAPSTLAELIAEGERGGTGEALKRIAELKKTWGEWVDSLKKSAAATKMLRGYFASADNLALQPQDNKDKFAKYLTDFAATRTSEFLVANQKYLDGLLSACKAQQEAEDF